MEKFIAVLAIMTGDWTSQSRMSIQISTNGTEGAETFLNGLKDQCAAFPEKDNQQIVNDYLDSY